MGSLYASDADLLLLGKGIRGKKKVAKTSKIYPSKTYPVGHVFFRNQDPSYSLETGHWWNPIEEEERVKKYAMRAGESFQEGGNFKGTAILPITLFAIPDESVAFFQRATLNVAKRLGMKLEDVGSGELPLDMLESELRKNPPDWVVGIEKEMAVYSSRFLVSPMIMGHGNIEPDEYPFFQNFSGHTLPDEYGKRDLFFFPHNQQWQHGVYLFHPTSVLKIERIYDERQAYGRRGMTDPIGTYVLVSDGEMETMPGGIYVETIAEALDFERRPDRPRPSKFFFKVLNNDPAVSRADSSNESYFEGFMSTIDEMGGDCATIHVVKFSPNFGPIEIEFLIMRAEELGFILWVTPELESKIEKWKKPLSDYGFCEEVKGFEVRRL